MSNEHISLADTKGLWSVVVYSNMCKVLQSLNSLVHFSQSWLQFLSKQCKVDIYKSIKHINYM